MSYIYDALTVPSISALKALNSSSTPKRVDNLFLTVKENGKSIPGWYYYKASATDTENLPDIVASDDGVGRWFHFKGSGSGGKSFGGGIICTTGATIVGSGKGFAFYAPQTNLELEAQIGYGLNITSGSTSIQLHKWSQEPNTGLTGRTFVEAIAHTGGKVTITADSTFKWISFFAKNPANSNLYDGLYFVVHGNVVTLLNF